jgi:hypothetical protein
MTTTIGSDWNAMRRPRRVPSHQALQTDKGKKEFKVKHFLD